MGECTKDPSGHRVTVPGSGMGMSDPGVGGGYMKDPGTGI